VLGWNVKFAVGALVVTVTGCCTEAVWPTSSVTVSRTWNVRVEFVV
jgi:hypothetical protein